RGVGHLGDAVAGHLEASNLVCRTETVLQRPDESKRSLAVTLEVADDVDEMLEDPRPGDLAVLGDVPDDDDRQTPLLCDADQRRRNLAHLARLAGRAIGQ